MVMGMVAIEIDKSLHLGFRGNSLIIIYYGYLKDLEGIPWGGRRNSLRISR